MPAWKRLPILVTGYNRPDKLERVLRHLSEIGMSELYIACDGPRDAEDARRVAECHRIARLYVKRDDRLLFQVTNLRCYLAMRAAISWFFSAEECGVVNEDDVIIDVTFFRAASVLLEQFRNDRTIFHINSYVAPPQDAVRAPFFKSTFVSSWGWATWRDRWHFFDADLDLSPRARRAIRSAAGSLDAYVFFLLVFRLTSQGKISSWAFRWIYTVWVNGAKAVTPRHSLCETIGLGMGATHTRHQDHLAVERHALSMSDFAVPFHLENVSPLVDREVHRHVSMSRSFLRLSRLVVQVLVPSWLFWRIRGIVR
jgi:hypothetical protein